MLFPSINLLAPYFSLKQYNQATLQLTSSDMNLSKKRLLHLSPEMTLQKNQEITYP